MNNKEFAGGLIGTILSAVGTATQTMEMLQIVSLVITILGGCITLIVIPLVNWYNKAKQDNKIDTKEINEACDIIKDGVSHIQDDIKKGETDDHTKG